MVHANVGFPCVLKWPQVRSALYVVLRYSYE